MTFLEKKRFFSEAASQKGYGYSDIKGDIPHLRVQVTFPESSIEIGLYFLFISFYGKFKIFAKKATFHFLL